MEWAAYYQADPEHMWSEQQVNDWLSSFQPDPPADVLQLTAEQPQVEAYSGEMQSAPEELNIATHTSADDAGVPSQTPHAAQDNGLGDSGLSSQTGSGPFSSADAQAGATIPDEPGDFLIIQRTSSCRRHGR